MALASATSWEIRTTGVDTNGGGFVTGASGTDWSQQDAAQYTRTDGSMVTPGTTFTSAGANFGTDVVGNIIQITAGSDIATGFYQITGRPTSTTLTLDRTAGVSAVGTADATYYIGGALLTPGKCSAAMAAGNKAWIKSGTYTVTSASTNVAAGCLAPAAGTGTDQTEVEGYTSTRGDRSTKPIIKADGVITSFALIVTSSQNNVQIANLELDGNSRTTSRGITMGGAHNRCIDCTFKNFTNSAISASAGLTSEVINCTATGCATQTAFSAPNCFACVAYANTVTAFNVGMAVECWSINNTGASTDGFVLGSNGSRLFRCVSYGNGRHGFHFQAAAGSGAAFNCIAENNAGYGYTSNSTPADGNRMFNCAHYNNTSGGVNATTLPANTQSGTITLTASAFTTPGSLDFNLNNTAGGGALLRASASAGVAYPASYSYVTATNYADVGPAQVAPSAGGGVSLARLVNGE